MFESAFPLIKKQARVLALCALFPVYVPSKTRMPDTVSYTPLPRPSANYQNSEKQVESEKIFLLPGPKATHTTAFVSGESLPEPRKKLLTLPSPYFMPYYLTGMEELRWDALNQYAFQKSGQKLIWQKNKSLQPRANDWLIFPVASSRVVRIEWLKKTHDLDGLKLWRADGNGLWQQVTDFTWIDEKTLLLAPLLEKPSWLALIYPKKALNLNPVAIYESRLVHVERGNAFYQTEQPLDAKVHEKKLYWPLTSANQLEFWRLSVDQPLKFKVRGPSVVKVSALSPLLANTYELTQWRWMDSYLDGQFIKSYNLTERSINNSIYFEKNKPKLGTWRQYRYITIPKGQHILTLKSLMPLFVQVSSAYRRFSFSAINEKGLRHSLDLKGYQLNQWSNQKSLEMGILARHMNKILSYEEHTLKNTWPLYLLMKLAVARPFDVIAQRWKNLALRSNSYYSSLWPESLPIVGGKMVAVPEAPQYQLRRNKLGIRVISQAYAENLTSKSTSTSFTQLPNKKKIKLKFSIPAYLHGPRIMRLLFSTKKTLDHPIKIFLRSNTGSTKEFVFTGPIQKKVLEKRWSSLEVASYFMVGSALAWQGMPLLGYGSPTSTPIMKTAGASFVLEETVNTLIAEIDASEANAESWISLQVRVPEAHKFSEAEYLLLLKNTTLKQRWRWFKELVSAMRKSIDANQALKLQVPDNLNSVARLKYDFKNELVSSLYYVASQYAALKSLAGQRLNTPEIESQKQEKEIANKARELDKSKKQNIAIKYWVKLLSSKNEKLQLAALLKVSAELLRKKEYQSLENMLRYYYFHADSAPVRKVVYHHLIELYSRLHEQKKKIAYRASELYLQPRIALVQEFANYYRKEADATNLLKILTLLPLNKVNSKALAWSAYQNYWLRLIRYSETFMQSEHQQHLWEGMLKMRNNAWDAAMHLWEKAGREGKKLIRHWEIGNEIKKEILEKKSTPDIITARWLKWSRRIGDLRWVSAENQVESYAGILDVHSVSQKNYRTFLATQSEPVLMTVEGPEQLQLTIRPVFYGQYKTNNKLAWVYWSDGSLKESWPIFRSFTSPTLQIMNQLNWRLGTKEQIRLKVEPGRHKIKFYVESQPVSLYVEHFISTEPKTLLSQLDLENLSKIEWNTHSFLCSNYNANQKTFVYNRGNKYFNFSKKTNEKIIEKFCKVDWNLYEKSLAKLNQGKPISLLGDHAQVIFQMGKYSEIAEKNEKQRLTAISKAQMLFLKYSFIPRVRMLWSQISSRTRWKPVDSIKSSLGLFLTQKKRWIPEGERLKLASSMSGISEPQDNLLLSSSRLELLYQNKTPANLELSLELKEPNYLRAENAYVNYQLSDGVSETYQLTPEKPRKKIVLAIPKGEHRLRFWLKNPIRGQYVKLMISHTLPSGEKVYLNPKTTKRYRLISAAHPADVSVEGPTVVRIDKLINKKIKVSYHFVSSGQHHLKVDATKEQGEIGIRVYQRVLSKPRIYRMRESQNPLSDMVVEENSNKINDFLKYMYFPYWISSAGDQLPLNHQQSGTWKFDTGYISRFHKADEIAQIEHFGLLQAGYFYHENNHDIFYHLSGSAHFHTDKGDPAFGGIANVFGKWVPTVNTPTYTYWFFNKYFTQRIPNKKNWAYELESRAGFGQLRYLTHWISHFPNLVLHGRLMNTKKVPTRFINQVDQDVFTRYDSDHRTQAEIEDFFIIKPRWDTRILVSASLLSNDDYNIFNPDRFKMSATVLQQFNKIMTSFTYTRSYYYQDKNRRRNRIVQRYLLNFDYFMWARYQQLLDWQCRLGWDPDVRDTLFLFKLTFLHDVGRGLSDLPPSPRLRDLQAEVMTKYNLIGDLYGNQE